MSSAPSPFRDIDRQLQAFRRQLLHTRAAVAARGGAAVRADELGWWKCSYRPTRGDRRRVVVRARSPAELIERLKAARPRRKQKSIPAGSDSAGAAP